MSSRTLVPPMVAWHSIPRKSPRAMTTYQSLTQKKRGEKENKKKEEGKGTFWICWASSRVGSRIRTWGSLTVWSNLWRMEMAMVAVLPVPAWP